MLVCLFLGCVLCQLLHMCNCRYEYFQGPSLMSGVQSVSMSFVTFLWFFSYECVFTIFFGCFGCMNMCVLTTWLSLVTVVSVHDCKICLYSSHSSRVSPYPIVYGNATCGEYTIPLCGVIVENITVCVLLCIHTCASRSTWLILYIKVCHEPLILVIVSYCCRVRFVVFLTMLVCVSTRSFFKYCFN